MQMQIADFVATISRQKRKKFCNIIAALSKSIENNIKDSYVNNIVTDWRYTCIPNCHVQTRRVYLEGNNALLSNIPHPHPICLSDNHSYLSIYEMIAHYLALGIPMHELWSDRKVDVKTCTYSNLYESPQVYRIVQNVVDLYHGERVLILLGIEFSDDFDPNNSVKNNRQKVWMKSLSISPPSNNLHGMTTTFPVSFGIKDNCHQIVENHMYDELSLLSDPRKCNMFYNRQTDSMVRVHFELLISLQDQPERRHCTGILLGNSRNYAARWGFSCNLSAIKSRIVSCSQCLQQLMSPQIPVSDCKQCTNWEIISSSTTLLQSDVNEKYPHQLKGNELPRKICPFKLSFNLLNEAVTNAHVEFIEKRWTKDEVTYYLSTYCLNTNTVKCVLEHSENIVTMKQIEDHKNTLKRDYEAMESCRNVNPQSYQDWKTPASWRRFMTIEQHIDVTMHLLFLGIVKTVALEIHSWAKMRSQNNILVGYLQSVLDPLTTFNLNWLKVINYVGGKMGGWVSENYIALARISKWAYTGLYFISKDYKYVEPARPYKEWSGVECANWLRARALDTSGKATDLKTRVRTLMQSSHGPPNIAQPKGGSVLDVINVVKSLQAMISHIMMDRVNEQSVLEVKRHIKLFLFMFNKMNCNMKDTDSSTETWITKYNFPCLLNIPQQMLNFGPVHHYWEGGGLGEKFVQVAKKHFHSFGKNWNTNLIRKIVKCQTLSILSGSDIEHFDPVDNSDYMHCHQNKKMGVYYYKSTLVPQRDLSCHKPLAFLQLESNELVICVHNNIFITLIMECYEKELFSLHYFRWATCKKIYHGHVNIKRSCILLPIPVVEKSSSASIYTAIAHDYSEINADGIFIKRPLGKDDFCSTTGIGVEEKGI